MQLKPEQERVSSLLKETITLMCKNGLKFETKFTIDAVIGVTLDEKEVFLISVNEIFNTEKSAINDDNSSNASDAEMGSISHRKKRKRNRCIKKESGSDGESGQEQDEEKADEHSDALNLDSNDDNSIMFIKEEPQTSSWQTSSCSFQDQNVGGQSELKFSSYPGADTSHDATDLNFGDPSFPSGINQSLIGRSGARQQGASTYLTASGNKHAVMPQLGDQTFMSQTGGNQTQGPNQSVIFHVETHPKFHWFRQCVTFNFFPSPGYELAYNLFTLIAVYGLPLIVIIVSYSLILVEMTRKTQQSKEDSQQPINALTRDTLRRSGVGHIQKARLRTLKMTIVIVSVFILCWTPYFLISAWWWFDRKSAANVNPMVQRGLFLFAVSNSCADPIVYGMFTGSIRKTLFGFCCQKRPRDVFNAREQVACNPVVLTALGSQRSVPKRHQCPSLNGRRDCGVLPRQTCHASSPKSAYS